MDAFFVSSFGMFGMGLFHGLFTAPSWQSFVLLACGWALTTDRHTLTTYVWLTGATTVKHFSRFYGFLGCPLYSPRWHLWKAGIRQAARVVPAGAVMTVALDDTPKKRPAARSRASVATAMARAPPDENSAHCGA